MLQSYCSVTSFRGVIDAGENNVECCICLEPLVSPDDPSWNQCVGKIVKVNNCNHSFHAECIRSWYAESNTCPMCRQLFRAKVLLPASHPGVATASFIMTPAEVEIIMEIMDIGLKMVAVRKMTTSAQFLDASSSPESPRTDPRLTRASLRARQPTSVWRRPHYASSSSSSSESPPRHSTPAATLSVLEVLREQLLEVRSMYYRPRRPYFSSGSGSLSLQAEEGNRVR